MNNLVYLLVAVGLSCAGLLVLWLRNRPPTTSPRSSIEEFQGALRALAPEEEPSSDDSARERARRPGRRRGA